jgi:hypothetical protein
MGIQTRGLHALSVTLYLSAFVSIAVLPIVLIFGPWHAASGVAVAAGVLVTSGRPYRFHLRLDRS